VAGIVITQQRPMTAGGVTFVTFENEFGQLNMLVWRALGERYNATAGRAQLPRARIPLMKYG
jgi:error-prone DNA polymerase